MSDFDVIAVGDAKRWEDRALRAEAKLAELTHLLAEYREGMREYPRYAELAALLQG